VIIDVESLKASRRCGLLTIEVFGEEVSFNLNEVVAADRSIIMASSLISHLFDWLNSIFAEYTWPRVVWF
jgi:hypothetical protein